MRLWHSTVKTLVRLSGEYSLSQQDGEKHNVHRDTLTAALSRLDGAQTEIISPLLNDLRRSVTRPDKKGDRENGRGLHYYNAVKPSGAPEKSVSGCFRDGRGGFRSARTLFEEDYTMALSMYLSGFYARSGDALGRAVHMLSDVCCPMHAAGMSYTSRFRSLHHAYEQLAQRLSADLGGMGERDVSELEGLFGERISFARLFNHIAGQSAAELDKLASDPLSEIIERMYFTVDAIFVLLSRFCGDVGSPDTAQCMRSGDRIRLLPDTAPLSVSVTPRGIRLHGVNPSPDSGVSVTLLDLAAAHRRSGHFTLSPLSDKAGRVLEVSGKKLRLAPYDPRRSSQLFRVYEENCASAEI